MAPGAVEEVTCTVIQGVAFDQACPSDAELRAAEEDEDSISGRSSNGRRLVCQLVGELVSESGLVMN